MPTQAIGSIAGKGELYCGFEVLVAYHVIKARYDLAVFINNEGCGVSRDLKHIRIRACGEGAVVLTELHGVVAPTDAVFVVTVIKEGLNVLGLIR